MIRMCALDAAVYITGVTVFSTHCCSVGVDSNCSLISGWMCYSYCAVSRPHKRIQHQKGLDSDQRKLKVKAEEKMGVRLRMY